MIGPTHRPFKEYRPPEPNKKKMDKIFVSLILKEFHAQIKIMRDIFKKANQKSEPKDKSFSDFLLSASEEEIKTVLTKNQMKAVGYDQMWQIAPAWWPWHKIISGSEESIIKQYKHHQRAIRGLRMIAIGAILVGFIIVMMWSLN